MVIKRIIRGSFLLTGCFLLSCTSEDRSQARTRPMSSIRIGSSEMDNEKRFEEMHPEMKKAINHLMETNSHLPSIGSRLIVIPAKSCKD